MWTPNPFYATMALKSLCTFGINGDLVGAWSDIIDQMAAAIDRELTTLPELNDGHLSVLNDGYLSAVSDNVVSQQPYTDTIFIDLDKNIEYDDIEYDEIEEFLTNFNFNTEAAHRVEVNRVDSSHYDCNKQPTTVGAIDPIAHTDKATNFIIINEIGQGQLLSEHIGQDVKYFFLTVNVNENYLCDMSKTTINVYDPQSPTQLNSQQLQSLLKPVSITIDKESAAKLSLELAEASAKSKASPIGAQTSNNENTATVANTFVRPAVQPRLLPSRETARAQAEMKPKSRPRLFACHCEMRARILSANRDLITKIRSFHKHSFSEDPNGIIGNWSHRLDKSDLLSGMRKIKNITYGRRYNPVAHAVTHTLDDFRRRNLPCYPPSAPPKMNPI